MRVNSFVLLRELAVAGHGIARLPESFALPAVRAQKSRAVLDACCPSSRNVSPKVRAFLGVLEERFTSFFQALPM